MYFLLSRTQAGPGRTGKQEQEETSRNHVQTFSGCSVCEWFQKPLAHYGFVFVHAADPVHHPTHRTTSSLNQVAIYKVNLITATNHVNDVAIYATI